MQGMDDYVQIMVESLKKKSELLDRIIDKNKAQTVCIEGKEYEEINWDTFNVLMTEKEFLIDRINTMDEGFQSLFDRVKMQLEEDKEKYAESIRQMQKLVGEVTDKGVEIRTGEERNRAMIEKIVGGQKKLIRKSRNSLKVAQSYVQTMQGGAAMDMNLMDKKK